MMSWPVLAAAPAPLRTSAELTDEDRSWWAYQSVVRPEVPSFEEAARGTGFEIRTPVDAFLWRETNRRGERLPGLVGPAALLRRLTIDLTGLPPTPEDLEAFLSDSSWPAYERMVDRLLASPRFGEKWARQWLDVVRYAESDGYKQDAYRPHAWRYRDWVISALNDDMAYDRFVQQQLAGDILFPGDPTALVATGFFRAAVYEYNNRDAATQWAGLLAEATDTVGDAFLGLGLQCARCHNHKFDAIQQDDYERLQACFSSMVWRDDQPAGTLEEVADWQSREAQWRGDHAELLAALKSFEAPFKRRLADNALDKFPKKLEAIWRRGEGQWQKHEWAWMDFVRRQIEEEWRDLGKAMNAEEKKRWRELSDAVAAASASRPVPPPKALTISEVPHGAVQSGSDPSRPAGFLSVLGREAAEGIPRAALARWLTRPSHPLTARVIVNRIWQGYFGRGLVSTPNDFGRLGEKPASPELLDWLASECVEGGWKLKRLHRMIVTSEAYRLGAGGGRWWRETLPRRLTAEQIRDASLAASGELSLSGGGPSASGDALCRTIFTKVLRNAPDPLLQSFDAPDGFRSTGTRQPTVTPTQSLLLMNGQWMQKRSQALAENLRRRWPEQKIQRVREAYLRIACQDPSSEEIAEALVFLTRQEEMARRGALPPVPELAFAESRDLPRHGMALVVGASTIEKRLFPAMTAVRPESMDSAGFTIEAVVYLRSLGTKENWRTVASCWSGDSRQGWALGVAGHGAPVRPGTLVMHLMGKTEAGGDKLELAVSDLVIPVNRPWFVAASWSPGQIRLIIQDLGDPDAAAREMALPVEIVRLAPDHDVPVVLGARSDALRSHPFDGLIGEVRLTGQPLGVEALLPMGAAPPAEVVGHWKFEMATGLLGDSGSAGHALEIPVPPDAPDAEQTALADLCHVLLNSNAFLYVD